MRALIAYAVASTVAVVALAFTLNTANHRIAALEHQAAAAPIAVADTKPSGSSRTYRASNGVVLTAKELDEQDAIERNLERSAARFEYSIKKPPSQR